MHPDNILIRKSDQKEALILDTPKITEWNIYKYQQK
jgi:hypothetical protein